jgi:hypothetical protein
MTNQTAHPRMSRKITSMKMVKADMRVLLGKRKSGSDGSLPDSG